MLTVSSILLARVNSAWECRKVKSKKIDIPKQVADFDFSNLNRTEDDDRQH